MALINRVSRLFKADFHAVLDQIEEPEQLLKQAIRDMEDDLAGSEQSIANSLHQQDVMAARRDEIHTSVNDLDDQLDLCFESGKEDLSRSLIRKKLEAERLLKRLISKYESNASQLKEQQVSLEANRSTLHGLRQKAELFAHRLPSHESGDAFDDAAWFSRDMNIGDDEVEIAFLREKSRRSAS